VPKSRLLLLVWTKKIPKEKTKLIYYEQTQAARTSILILTRTPFDKVSKTVLISFVKPLVREIWAKNGKFHRKMRKNFIAEKLQIALAATVFELESWEFHRFNPLVVLFKMSFKSWRSDLKQRS